MGAAPIVARLDEQDLAAVVDVLADAFADYPVMRHVLQGSSDYARDLAVLLRFFANVRLLRQEPIFGVALDRDLTGVALVSFPAAASPAALAAHRTAVWEALGAAARGRYERFGDATGALFQGLSRIHLNMIGVRRESQGHGVGRALLEAVAELAHSRTESDGVTLTTEVRPNVDLYRKFGYDVIGHVEVAPDLETWGMLKRRRP